jgi:hypothetical protein
MADIEGKNKPRPCTIHHPAFVAGVPLQSMKYAAAWLGTDFLTTMYPEGIVEQDTYVHEAVVRFFIKTGTTGSGLWDGVTVTDGHQLNLKVPRIYSPAIQPSISASYQPFNSGTPQPSNSVTQELQNPLTPERTNSTTPQLVNSTAIKSTLQAECIYPDSTVKARCTQSELNVNAGKDEFDLMWDAL